MRSQDYFRDGDMQVLYDKIIAMVAVAWPQTAEA